MKHILLFLLFAALSFAQTISVTELQRGSDMEYYFTGVCDSGTVTSGAIKLNKYDASLASYPLGYSLVFDTLAASGEITAVYVEGKGYAGAYTIVDTIFAADTLEAGGLSFNGVASLNTNLAVYPEYRISVETSTAKGNTFRIKLSLYAYKED